MFLIQDTKILQYPIAEFEFRNLRLVESGVTVVLATLGRTEVTECKHYIVAHMYLILS